MKFKRFLVSLLVIVITYFGSNAILNKLQDKKNISNYGIAAAQENKEQKVPHEILMLLVGVDVNGDSNLNTDFTRTDTIMLCKINAETGKIDLLSIPRDSRIKVREEFTKANHAHAYGGIELTLQSLRKFLGLDIDYYAEVDYEGLVEIVDAMGGVEYTVPEGINIDHGDVHLRPGRTKMDGMDVLWYLRTRKIYNNGDLGRVQTQQEFMKNIVNELVKKSKTMNMPAFIESYFKYVKTNIPLSVMLDFARNISNFSSDKFTNYTVPGVANDIDGTSYYIPDYEKTWDLVDRVFGKYKLNGWKKEDSGYYEYDNFNYSYENDDSSNDGSNDYKNESNLDYDNENLNSDNNDEKLNLENKDEELNLDNDENLNDEKNFLDDRVDEDENKKVYDNIASN